MFSRCTEIHDWVPIEKHILKYQNKDGFFDGPDIDTRRSITLEDYPLLSDDGLEKPIYGVDGKCIPRRRIVVVESSCGVLVDLENIQSLFNPYSSTTDSDDSSSSSAAFVDHSIHIDAYPLGFLKSVGNIQASGIPHCFYPVLKEINTSVGKSLPLRATPYRSDEDVNLDDDEEDSDADRMSTSYDNEDRPYRIQVVKPVSSQFYNHITHRVASRSGKHDSQHGTVTAAISGAFANTDKDKKTALDRQSYCELCLPSERFGCRINQEDCPTSCRAELVYSVDVRALKEPSGSYVVFRPVPLTYFVLLFPSYSAIYKDVILPLARAWNLGRIRNSVNDHLVVLKPEVCTISPSAPFYCFFSMLSF